MPDWLANPYVQAAFIGFVTAALVDYQVARSWMAFQEFTHFNWGVALGRWVQGTIVGLVLAFGFDVLT